MAKTSKKRDEDSDEDDETEVEESDMDDEDLPPFFLGRSLKLAGFTLIAYFLFMSDVFVLRVMDKAGVGLVSGRTPTKKGICMQGLGLVFAMVILDLLITKEKL